jgi:hypothetical protein
LVHPYFPAFAGCEAHYSCYGTKKTAFFRLKAMARSGNSSSTLFPLRVVWNNVRYPFVPRNALIHNAQKFIAPYALVEDLISGSLRMPSDFSFILAFPCQEDSSVTRHLPLIV